MLTIYFSGVSFNIDFFLAGLLGFFACRTLYKNKKTASSVLSAFGLLLSLIEIATIAVIFKVSEYGVSLIYSIVFWTVMIVFNIRVIRAKDIVLCFKTFYAIPVLIMGYWIVPWFDIVPEIYLNVMEVDNSIIYQQVTTRLLVDLQYLICGGIIGFAVLRFVKKQGVPVQKTAAKRKILIAAIMVSSIILIMVVTPFFVIGDVSTSLRIPSALFAKPETGYYDDEFNAVRKERLYRSILMESGMIVNPGLYEHDFGLFEEIQRDSVFALMSWGVIALTTYWSFRIQKKRHMQNASAFFTIATLWLCILGVYVISFITALLGFIYVPVSFLIAGVAVAIVYKTAHNRTIKESILIEVEATATTEVLQQGLISSQQATPMKEPILFVDRNLDNYKNGCENDKGNQNSKDEDGFCYKCGHPLREGSLFCSKCGADLQ